MQPRDSGVLSYAILAPSQNHECSDIQAVFPHHVRVQTIASLAFPAFLTHCALRRGAGGAGKVDESHMLGGDVLAPRVEYLGLTKFWGSGIDSPRLKQSTSQEEAFKFDTSSNGDQYIVLCVGKGGFQTARREWLPQIHPSYALKED